VTHSAEELAHAARRRLPPAITYPQELPISAHREEILAALRAHQVTVVAGETGSGKSTQLAKMCLEAGRGVAGMIGHTQPRRIAARSIAERVAAELGTELGELVGYKVRFTDKVGQQALVKVMTDGVLLAELHGDPMLYSYDTLIIDEAHERSLNIDFILGYLKRLLQQRPDIKLVVTSATIDTEKFSAHFGEAPVIEVSGRAYPVDVRYRPPAEDEDGDRDQVQSVCDAVGELCREGPGDILVFLSGEREIRDTAEALSKSHRDLEVLPLYARLSSADQHRVFQPHARRRVVLATNVAETSLTVPGIRYVVDLGTARISRYSRRTKVQRLPIEPISQASANQRAGRCGRLGPGICLRLYSEEDFSVRAPFSEPEILRTNLASVVLQMAAIGLGDIADFPFLDSPDRRNIKDGVTLLQELGALSGEGKLTPVGRKLARLPVDPRLGRMVLEGAKSGCLGQVIIVAAGLSVQDPRERPAGKEERADGLHARFSDPGSDFVSYVALWDAMEEAETTGEFRRFCRREMISYQRAREWQDVVSQLDEICRSLGLRRGHGPVTKLAPRAALHQALLAGLITNVGWLERDRATYLGVRNARFALWPGSVVAKAKRQPRWVMAAELVETGRLWGRVVAPVQPQWVEMAAAHLLRWSYGEPYWDPSSGACYTLARASLYGLPIVNDRRVDFARLDPRACRDMFIQHALVDGDWEQAPPFVARNRTLVEELRSLARRSRRHDLWVGDEKLFTFYDARLPGSVASGSTFARWWSRGGFPLLEAEPGDLVRRSGTTWPNPADYPDQWQVEGGPPVRLQYKWQPGEPEDGVSVDVPIGRLAELPAVGIEWQVPGLREDLVFALVRSLPKDIRRQAGPARELARSFVANHGPHEGPLLVVLASAVREATDRPVRAADFDWAKVPREQRPVYRVTGEGGRVLAAGRDPSKVMSVLQPFLSSALAQAGRSAGLVRSGLQEWDFGELPKRFEASWQGSPVVGYPALVDEGESAGVQVVTTEALQRRSMISGTSRLILPALNRRLNRLEGLLGKRAWAVLAGTGVYGSVRELVEDVALAVVDGLVVTAGGPAWDREAFEALLSSVSEKFDDLAGTAVVSTGRALARARGIQRRLEDLGEKAVLSPPDAPLRSALEDMAQQLSGLVGPGFVRSAGVGRLGDIERYLAALDQRLVKLPLDPRRDQVQLRRIKAVERTLALARDAVRGGEEHLPEAETTLEELRWTLEELRVSLFAQQLGARVPVSAERLMRSIKALLG
jgi:ATP-dependent helicase HrpA